MAQTGTISGIVQDSLTGDPVIGANVLIVNTQLGAATDVNGHFELKNIQPGKYDLEISCIGYEKSLIKDIVVKAFQNVKISAKLTTQNIVLEELSIISPKPGIQKDMTNTISIRGSQSGQVAYFIKPQQEFNTEEYAYIEENDFRDVLKTPLSTFSIDVDAASYSNTRRFLMDGVLPPKDAVRVEEFINYFDYDYPQPKDNVPFEIITEYSKCPWNKDNYLVHIGLQGKKIINEERQPNSLTFLLDVSGSMSSDDKLPLLKKAFKMLVEQLNEKDQIAIVVYAGAAGLVLPSTKGSDKEKILEAINNLQSGGSTAGGEGIKLAYKTAKENFIRNGNNRVILATDGDFNIGISNTSELVRYLDEQKNFGIFLTVLGFGTENIKDSRLEQFADKGNGNYSYIDNILEAKKVFVDELGATLYTIAKDVKIQVEFNPTRVKSYRLVGYENRMLNTEDFDNDKKDAGEIGAGHSVTALYEIVPADKNALTSESDLKYQETKIIKSDELLTVNIRYKDPDKDESKLISRVLKGQPSSIERASENFRFSAAVAEFGMLLRDSKYKAECSFRELKELAMDSKGSDKHGYRAEFLRLVDLAEKLERKEID